MSRPVPSRLCVLLLLVAVPVAAHGPGETAAGKSVNELFPWASFDPGIPTQAEVLDVEPGSRPLTHGEAIHYLRVLAAASPRMTLIEYARSHEQRELVYLAIGPSALIADLDRFREEHTARVDPRGHAPGQDAERLRDARAVAWLAYGIHGDELSSVDAACAVAYWLVAGRDDRAKNLRENLLILIDPIENPDGRDRYLAQTRAFAHAVPIPDGEDLSHRATWPWGRGNHYLFDLNRDWFSLVHPESRRSTMIAGWNPQLMVDSHEMGSQSTYLFSPPRHPFNPHLGSTQRKWGEKFGADQAGGLDTRGYAYFTRDWNEEFFPGYGSSWASYRGAIGILYEMSRTSGTLVRQRAGTTRTYPQAVEHHVASSVANLETLAANRAEILTDFVADRREAMERAGDGAVAAWILPRGRHPERTDKLVGLLIDQGIEVFRSTATPPNVSGLRDIYTGDAVEALDGDAWLVPVAQPAAPMVRVLLDPHVPMDATFFREEREYLERGKGSRLYDVTAWSMPLNYGIEAYWTNETPGDGWEPGVPEKPSGRLETEPDSFGYLIEGNSDESMRALADMLQRGIRVKVAEKPFAISGREYGHGAILVQHEANPDGLEEDLRSVAERWGVEILPTSTAKAEHGPDLGGSHFRTLIEPRIGIWTGYPISPSAYGALWHLIDFDLRVRFSALDIGGFAGVDLDRYNVLIFPPAFGRAAVYRAMLGEIGVARLKGWIEAGGTAIGVGSGAGFLADESNELTRTRLRSQALASFPPVVLGPGAVEADQGGPFRAAGIAAAKEPEAADDDGKKKKKKAPPVPRRSSPYDVAPMLGPGARPFAEGFEQGTAVELKPVDLATWIKPLLPPGKSKAEDEELSVADARLLRFSPQGVFLRVELDPNLWMTWGMPKEIPVLARARDTLVADAPVQVPARFADLERLHLGGLLWPEAAGRLAHTAYATRESLGKGQVILFLNEPEFRGWTLASRRILLNAIFYGPGLGTRWSSPW